MKAKIKHFIIELEEKEEYTNEDYIEIQGKLSQKNIEPFMQIQESMHPIEKKPCTRFIFSKTPDIFKSYSNPASSFMELFFCIGAAPYGFMPHTLLPGL
jgi:hypothetical protein